MARRRAPVRNAGPSPPGRVRIVAGKWRGRRLAVADVPGLRPTPERVRETLFNWLAPAIEGARCLDLFAGTGALGFEALSRGAARVVLVEHSPAAVRALQESIAVLDAADATVYRGDAFRFLEQSEPSRQDIVFLDPPFGDDRVAELCRLLAGSPWLAPAAVVYLEDDRGRPEAELPDGWRVAREKCAGNVRYALIAAGSGHV
jgi:16S rRNA (guanine966-N2)-methyltransferase